MKKRTKGILILLLALAAVAGISTVTTACQRSCRVIEGPVCYYGCPNSKRVKKLNLKRREENA